MPKPVSPRPWWQLPVIIILWLVVLGGLWAVVSLVFGVAQSLREFAAPALVTADPELPEPRAPLPDLRGFDAGNIISDQVFYDVDAMSLEEIQAFLEAAGKGCRPGPDSTPCLMNYREDTPTWEPSERCSGYTGVVGEAASVIIYKTAQACGINPQVLLVTLQKEQGLVTASSGGLTARRYQTAMGFACPDGGSCDPEYFGFATQLYSAAAQFQRYRQNPGGFAYRAAESPEIAYAPQPECGASPVHLQNQATAALYNYTPYQPSPATLQGARDECSSFGNANFYGYFRVWFGDPRR